MILRPISTSISDDKLTGFPCSVSGLFWFGSAFCISAILLAEQLVCTASWLPKHGDQAVLPSNTMVGEEFSKSD